MTAKDGTTVTLVRKKRALLPGPPVKHVSSSSTAAKSATAFFLKGKDLVLGRSETAQIRIEDNSISRRHARLFQNPSGCWCLMDLKSTNGTFVNEEAVREKELQDGDLIQIGQTVLKYLSGGHIEQRYYEEIYRLTHFDPLTQAYSKLYFLRALEQEMNRYRRYGRPLSLALIDLDHFKKVNDRYGHLIGDRILRETTALIQKQIRNTDFFARYGGEEFTLILPETDRRKAQQLCEKLRKTIEGHRYAHEDRHIRLTISIGLASLEGDKKDMTLHEFIAVADGKLYEAKRKGRNRVVV